MSDQEKTFWLDAKKNVDLLFYVLCALCGLLLLADLIVHRHAHYESIHFEEWPFFYSIFGFVVFVLIVLSGKPLRRILMRREDYYDD